MSRTTVTQLDALMDKCDGYSQGKDVARKAIQSALIAAYREADESPIIRDMLMESARTIARLEFEVEGLKEAVAVRAPAFMPCPINVSGGVYCDLAAGHFGNHYTNYINLEETK